MSELLALVIAGVAAAGALQVLLGLRGGPSRPSRVQTRLGGALRDRLTQADLSHIAPRHVVLASAAASAIASTVCLALTRSPWIATAFAILFATLPFTALRARARQRRRVLEGCWPDAIDHLASGIRAGLALGEAVMALAERGPAPLRPAFASFARDYRATGRFSASLDALAARLADPAADRVIVTLHIAREVGGSDLGRTLRTLSSFLRAQYQLRRELEARQSWVVVAARLAYATPWAVLLLLSVHQQAARAYQAPAGALVIAGGGAVATLGYWLMRRVGASPEERRVLLLGPGVIGGVS